MPPKTGSSQEIHRHASAAIHWRHPFLSDGVVERKAALRAGSTLPTRGQLLRKCQALAQGFVACHHEFKGGNTPPSCTAPFSHPSFQMKNFKALVAGLVALGAFAPAAFADTSDSTKFQYTRSFACDIAADDSTVAMTKTGDQLDGSTGLTVTGDTSLAKVTVQVGDTSASENVTLQAGSAIVTLDGVSSEAVTGSGGSKSDNFVHTSVASAMTLSAQVTGATALGLYEIPVEVTCAEA